MNRREFLQLATATATSSLFPLNRVLAYSNGKDDEANKRLIVILLRGGADGLNIVVPYGDSTYRQIRPRIAVNGPGQDHGVIDLDGHWGLHPALAPLMPYWQNKSLAFVHSSGSPDPTRSHFDAQDYMESGAPGLKSMHTGWLNRLVSTLPSKGSPIQAVSVGPLLPRIFSGPYSVATVAPEKKSRPMAVDRPGVEGAFTQLYSGRKDELSNVYAEGLAAHKEVKTAMEATAKEDEAMAMEQKEANKGAPTPRNFNYFGKQIAGLIKHDPAVQVAFVDFGGWDTHVNEGAGQGQLANHLQPLTNGIADLIQGLGPTYKNTQIVVMSEFGRTAKENGNGGTDHGHGNVMWVFGSNVPGGKVYARWNGLAPNGLHEGRDLPTSTDFRSVLATMVSDHLGVSTQQMGKIFPNFRADANPFVQV